MPTSSNPTVNHPMSPVVKQTGSTATDRGRRRFQFSTRALFGLTAAVALALGGWTWWSSLPTRTAEQFARRLERGDRRAAYGMVTEGKDDLKRYLPNTGQLQLRKLEGRPRPLAHWVLRRQEFDVEMQWITENTKARDTIVATLLVQRGALSVKQVGIRVENVDTSIELFTKCPREDATHLLAVTLLLDGAFQSREYEFFLSRDRFDPVDFDAMWILGPRCDDGALARYWARRWAEACGYGDSVNLEDHIDPGINVWVFLDWTKPDGSRVRIDRVITVPGSPGSERVLGDGVLLKTTLESLETESSDRGGSGWPQKTGGPDEVEFPARK